MVNNVVLIVFVGNVKLYKFFFWCDFVYFNVVMWIFNNVFVLDLDKEDIFVL